MTDNGSPPSVVEKIMSIRRDEFEAGLARLAGQPVRGMVDLSTAAVRYELVATGFTPNRVDCAFFELPGVVLGGLLQLPRARILLDLCALPGPSRERFLARFDLNFQRGGG